MSTSSLDLRNIFEVPLRLFAPWLGAVIIVWLAGYPGVVCATPLAWLLALQVGNRIAARSRSTSASQRLLEAALAGALFGLLQGALFGIVVPSMGPMDAEDRSRTVVITMVMLIVGTIAGAALSWFTARLNERRRQAQAQ
jgi:hypothetical protein